MEYGWGQVPYFQRVRLWHAISGYYPGTFSTQFCHLVPIPYAIFTFNMLNIAHNLCDINENPYRLYDIARTSLDNISNS